MPPKVAPSGMKAYEERAAGKREVTDAASTSMQVVGEEERVYGRKDRDEVRRDITIFLQLTQDYAKKVKHHVAAINHISGEIKEIEREIESTNELVRNPERRKVEETNAMMRLVQQKKEILAQLHATFVSCFSENVDLLRYIHAESATQVQVQVPQLWLASEDEPDIVGLLGQYLEEALQTGLDSDTMFLRIKELYVEVNRLEKRVSSLEGPAGQAEQASKDLEDERRNGRSIATKDQETIQELQRQLQECKLDEKRRDKKNNETNANTERTIQMLEVENRQLIDENDDLERKVKEAVQSAEDLMEHAHESSKDLLAKNKKLREWLKTAERRTDDAYKVRVVREETLARNEVQIKTLMADLEEERKKSRLIGDAGMLAYLNEEQTDLATVLKTLEEENHKLKDIKTKYDDLVGQDRKSEMQLTNILRYTLDDLVFGTRTSPALGTLLSFFGMTIAPVLISSKTERNLYFANTYRSHVEEDNQGAETTLISLVPGLPHSHMIHAAFSVHDAMKSSLADIELMQAELTKALDRMEAVGKGTQDPKDEGYLQLVVLMTFNHLLYSSKCDSVRFCAIVGMFAQIFSASRTSIAPDGRLVVPALIEVARSSFLRFLTIGKLLLRYHRPDEIGYKQNENIDPDSTIPDLIIRFKDHDLAKDSNILVQPVPSGLLILMVESESAEEVVFFQSKQKQVTCWRGRWVVEAERGTGSWLVRMEPSLPLGQEHLVVQSYSELDSWLHKYHGKTMVDAVKATLNRDTESGAMEEDREI